MEKLIFVGCFITGAITIVLFHFYWLKNDTAIIVIPILSFFAIIYLIILYFVVKKKQYVDDVHKCVLIFDINCR